MGSYQSQQKHGQPMIEQIKGSKEPGFSPIYKKFGSQKIQFSPYEDVASVNDMLMRSFEKYSSKTALGYVIVDKQMGSEGKEVEKRSITYFTYTELKKISFNLAKSLAKYNLTYTEPYHKMKLISIYSPNRYEWIVTDIACIMLGITSVPLYDTLGIQNLSYCLKQTQVTTIFVAANTLKILLKLKQHGSLKTLILFDPLDQQTKQELEKLNFNLIYLKDLIQEGASINGNGFQIPKISPNDCLTFSYTSGTTGPPKGAMISHKNILSFTRAINTHPTLKVTQSDVHASYLPYPHVMQRAAMLSVFGLGATLVCTSGDMLKLKDDFQVIRPTLFLSVPRLFNRLVQVIKQKFEAESGMKKWLINRGVNSKLGWVDQYGTCHSSIYDTLIFSKVKQSFGGRIRIMASGSAPLSKQVHSFMQILMSSPLVQGYGQTQGGAAVIYSLGHKPGEYHFINDTSQIKLCSLPEMNYTAEDLDSQGNPSPKGQIWVRGSQVFIGYYRLEQITKDTITQDGWLKSGDIGQFNSKTNSFRIIDRKKNIFKLQQGEYIAPDKVQNVYMKSSLFSEVFLHGDSTENFAVLIAVPNKEELKNFATINQFEEKDLEKLSKYKKFRSRLLGQLNLMARKDGLNGFQIAKNLYLQFQPFASRNIMTNTAKLIRFQAKKYYKSQIQSMYKEGEITADKK